MTLIATWGDTCQAATAVPSTLWEMRRVFARVLSFEHCQTHCDLGRLYLCYHVVSGQYVVGDQSTATEIIDCPDAEDTAQSNSHNQIRRVTLVQGHQCRDKIVSWSFVVSQEAWYSVNTHSFVLFVELCSKSGSLPEVYSNQCCLGPLPIPLCLSTNTDRFRHA